MIYYTHAGWPDAKWQAALKCIGVNVQHGNIYARSIADHPRIELLANALKSEHGRAILETVQMLHDSLLKSLQIEADGMEDKDLRYRVAMINTLKIVMQYPEKAREYIEKYREEGVNER